MSLGAEGDRSTKGRAPAPPLRLADLLDLEDPPAGLSWREHLVQLLRIAASVEHALMVQYLFAAYSLAPEKGADEDEQRMIARWQNLILSVAKEEMGHLLTVQNVLCLLGEPAELGRENHPWDSGLYPFTLKLERLTLLSLARYIWAEMPDDIPVHPTEIHKLGELIDMLKPFLGDLLDGMERSGPPHVGHLYRYIIEVIGDPDRIPDSDFDYDSFRFQASWDDWGRGHNYKSLKKEPAEQPAFDRLLSIQQRVPTSSLNSVRWLAEMDLANSLMRGILPQPNVVDDIIAGGSMGEDWDHAPTRADVIIERAATRNQARDALIRISDQGEAASVVSGSHFDRFSSIFYDFKKAKEKQKDWEASHLVAENPHTRSPTGTQPESESTITWPRSEKWANLFNLRYRMLLTYLSHSFQLARDENGAVRGVIIHKVFGEMYNLKAIAGILVRLPLKDPPDDRHAGPPFEMPETSALSPVAAERWQLHRDLIDGALKLNAELRDLKNESGSPEEILFLRAMRELDEKSAEWIDHIGAGLMRGRAPSP